MSHHLEMIFLIIVVMASMPASNGLFSGDKFLLWRPLSHQMMTLITCSVSMLLYTGSALAVKRLAFGVSSCSCLISFKTYWPSFRQIGIMGQSLCTQKSNHLLQSVTNVPAQQTTGRNFDRVLWTFTVIRIFSSCSECCLIERQRNVTSASLLQT